MARRVPTFPEYKAAMLKQIGEDIHHLSDERLWESYIRVHPEAAITESDPPEVAVAQPRNGKFGPPTVVRIYKGNQASTASQFQNDAEYMEAEGYYPSSQVWAPGTYGFGAFILAAILCFVIIGIIIFIYMIIVKPDGSLTVTYRLNR